MYNTVENENQVSIIIVRFCKYNISIFLKVLKRNNKNDIWLDYKRHKQIEIQKE